MALLGLFAGPLIIVSGTVVLFGGDHGSDGGTFQAIATIPEFLWELSLGIYCTVKGFRPSSPILQGPVHGERSIATP
jgi:hypothetical protein